ncbi:MAG: HAD family hydrolase [Myxococcales bacterium]|nr:HAD family hydrolase [Myxococcales bacterium]
MSIGEPRPTPLAGDDASDKEPSPPALEVADSPETAAPSVDPLALTGSVARVAEIPHRRRIFCNRNLRMDEIAWVGFDMDYTLAIYNQRRIETLSVACTLDKLVQKRGYPEELLTLDYDPTFAIRGLVVDRLHGNIFKMDRFGHVDIVYHGCKKLDREERHRLYRTQRIRLSSPRYAWIDTLFALPEAVMFARIIDFLDGRPGRVRYGRLWQDIRDSIDEAHRDESMKRVIKSHLDEYLHREPDVAATLHKFRSSGKKLFLLTNSYWDYTDHLMTWLLDGQLAAYPSWRSYFDVVMVGAQKPAFFTEKRPFIELDSAGAELGPPMGGALLRGHIYQGGNVGELDHHLGVRGDRVLYIGDHIYGDMLRAKKASVWRTAMVVQELEEELAAAERMQPQITRIAELDRQRVRLDSDALFQQMVQEQLHRLEPGQVPEGVATLEAARSEVGIQLDRLRVALREVGSEVDAIEREVERNFNPWWGPLFKVGVENSRFGEQVEDYACVYTSRVSNFVSYSPLRYFRSPRDHMPHEL